MFFLVLAGLVGAASANLAAAIPTTVAIDGTISNGAALEHFWSKGVGSGHAALTTRADWREHMKMAHDDLGMAYVRYHAVLDDTSMYTDAPQNQKRQSYYDAISTYSYLISIGVRPVVELSFTPSPLANDTCHHFYYNGCEQVPTDLNLYYQYVFNFTSTLVDFFGPEEVATWYFEVYNEADLHWSFDQYFSLYTQAAKAVHAAHSGLRVGGPASAFPIWAKDLIAACKNNSVPLDFISSHAYPTTGGARNAEVKGLVKQIGNAAANTGGQFPLLITEWNGVCSSRGDWHDETAQPAFIIAAVDAIAAITPRPAMMAYWAVSDVFTEMGLPADPDPVAFHGGFGLITLYGVPKPGYKAFQLLNGAGDWRLGSSVIQHGGNLSVANLTAMPLLNRTTGTLRIFIASHGYVGEAIPNRTVTLQLNNIADVDGAWTLAGLQGKLTRLDDANCNPKALWQSWGSPNYIHPPQVAELKAEADLVSTTVQLSKSGSGYQIEIEIPAFGMAVLDVETKGL